MSKLAEALGKKELAAELDSQSAGFVRAFGSDGLMRADSSYYEGNRYNYSFRPVSDMDKRLSLCSREQLKSEALRFFGFTDAGDLSSRFEGVNNETDMEAPYFLHFLGLRRELCQVIKSGLDCMYTTGRGGIPGNNDSGGLSSCYIWNAIGLFPLTGQNRMLIGLPRFKRVTMELTTGELVIEKFGDGFTDTAELNGNSLSKLELSVSDFMRGGNLKIICNE